MDMTCQNCGSPFRVTTGRYNESITRSGTPPKACSRDCKKELQKTGTSKKCYNCGKSIYVQRANLRERNYCSQSCVAKVSNSMNPKRQRKEKPMKVAANRPSKIPNMTLAEIKERYKGTSNYHSIIRGDSRKVFAGEKSCHVCGYSLHVDICHLRPVSDFPMYTVLSIVNSLDNLIALCKRCHWEFDHGHLAL